MLPRCYRITVPLCSSCLRLLTTNAYASNLNTSARVQTVSKVQVLSI